MTGGGEKWGRITFELALKLCAELFKNSLIDALAGVAQWIEFNLKGLWFDSQLRHVPGL